MYIYTHMCSYFVHISSYAHMGRTVHAYVIYPSNHLYYIHICTHIYIFIVYIHTGKMAVWRGMGFEPLG